MVRDERDWPFILHGDLEVMLEWARCIEELLDRFNFLVESIEAAGQDHSVRLQLRYRDGDVVDLFDKRVAAFEFVTASDRGISTDTHSVELLDVVDITQGAELLGMGRAALYSRVLRADRAGEPMPFRRGPNRTWYSEPDSLLEWAASWKGRRARRSKPTG